MKSASSWSPFAHNALTHTGIHSFSQGENGPPGGYGLHDWAAGDHGRGTRRVNSAKFRGEVLAEVGASAIYPLLH